MPYEAPPPALDVAVVEMRQYTLKRGARDTLLALFDKFFVQGQEDAGIRVLGRYRDAADADRFVWFRGFHDMDSRRTSLGAFYGGPVWKAHRTAANATMIDSDDVLLLKPVDGARRLPEGRWLLTTVWLPREAIDDAFLRRWHEEIAPVLKAAGLPPVAAWRTEYAPNGFPALPVRAGEHAFAFACDFPDRAAAEKARDALASDPRWQRIESSLATTWAKPAQHLLLDPGQPAIGDGMHDFDWMQGEWRVTNRRLLERGVGSNRWDEFPATSAMRTYLGGLADVDEIHFPTKGWSGLTLRSYDRERREWNIWWINSRDGKMQSPVTGRWHGDTGTFTGVDMDGERPIQVVFTWKRLGPDAAHWEQAFSYDGGRTWETNWTNDFARVTPSASAPAPSR